ncbi:hypothetical protein GCM10027175_27480 [Hymenobacter latericoloratus]
MISLIFGGFVWLLEKLKKVMGLPEATASSSVINSPPQNLFNNEQFKLSIVDLDLDLEEEVGVDFSDWCYDTLGAYSPGVSRLLTTPEISGLHGQLVGTLCREWPDGIFLQLFEPTIRQPSTGTSWLVYLEFATLRWNKLEEVGGFYLSANYAEHGLFDGQDADGVVIQFRVEGIEDAFLPSLVV